MKKILCLLLCLTLLLSACGRENRQPPKTEVTLYYCHSESDQIAEFCSEIMAPEVRRVPLEPDDVAGLMEEYFKGPSEKSGLETMVPPGVELLEWSLDDTELYLGLNEAMNDMTAIRLRTAAACIARTAGAFLHVNTVRLRFDTASLASEENELLIELDKLVLEDHPINITGLPIKLHYLDSSGKYLLEEEYNITTDDFSEAVKQIVEALCHDSATGVGRSALPEGTLFLDAEHIDNSKACTVNLSPAFLNNRSGDEIRDRLSLLAIVNSLTQLDDLNSVRIQIEGKRIAPEVWPDASRALEYDERVLCKGDNSRQYYDAVLYVYGEDADIPIPFPVQLSQPDKDKVQSVLYALTCFRPKNGYSSPLYREEMPEYVLEAGVVTVTLPPALLEKHTDDRKQMLRCIQDSLEALPRIHEVRFISGGKSISS